MRGVIGLRRETKNTWERRVPLTPQMVQHLVKENNLQILVQPSGRRVFHDKEFVRAGATLTTDLSDAAVVLGVKEVAPELIIPGRTYMFFSHVIKGQPYNMPMLARLMEAGCTLIDYETVTDDEGRRLIFFGRFAGLAGMIDTLWALGERLAHEGHKTPFTDIQPAHTYDSLDDAKAAVAAAGENIARHGLPPELAPLVFGVAGYGNVAKGVREILNELPHREVAPDELDTLFTTGSVSAHCIYQCTFKEHDIVAAPDGSSDFELGDYYADPTGYTSRFAEALPYLTVVMNCNYWDERYPRLISKADLRELYSGEGRARLRVIGDLGCDIDGNVECTVRATLPDNPIYVWDVDEGIDRNGVAGNGPVVLAVDILPTELPREASEEFANCLHRFASALANTDYSVPFAELDLPPEIKRAVIVHRGELTPDYAHLQQYLD